MTGVLAVIEMLGNTIEQLKAELAAARRQCDELQAALEAARRATGPEETHAD